MYKLTNNEECLQVQFEADFDYGAIKKIIHHNAKIPGFERLHDLWLVGKHRSLLRLGDIQLLVEDFSRLYPAHSHTKKSAWVVQPGLTEAVMQLLAKGIDRQLPMTCRVFHTVEDARQWIQQENSPHV